MKFMAKSDQYARTRDGRVVTREEYINFLKDFFDKNGRTPSTKEIDNNEKLPAYSTLSSHFGSIESIYKELGDKYAEQYFPETKEDIDQWLFEFFKKTGKKATRRDVMADPALIVAMVKSYVFSVIHLENRAVYSLIRALN